ncbi:hypothetical protein ABZ070_14470 [Streptomyces sp. NPDC006283]|uniref:hypothetical protein n=1 Tax=Streptomyces sp. NPDC006283 TaxID=3156741 RepID=UPI0033B4A7B7
MPATHIPGRHRAPARPKALLGICAALAAGALLTGAALLIGGETGEAAGEPVAPVADIEVGGRPNLIRPTDALPTPGATPSASKPAAPATTARPTPSASTSTSTPPSPRPSSPSSPPAAASSTAPSPSTTPSDDWRDRDNCRDDRDDDDHPGDGGNGRWDRDDCW